MRLLRRIFNLLIRAAESWSAHRASTMGAAIAFYTLFSMCPVLLITITVVGTFYGGDAARHELLQQVQQVLGSSAALQVGSVIDSVGPKQSLWWQTLIGIGASLFAATTVFSELKDSLDVIWGTPKNPHGSLWTMLRKRLLSFGLVISLGFILLTSMVVSAAISAFMTFYGTAFGGSLMVISIINNTLSTLIVALLFGAIFKVLPEQHIPWHVVWQSALLTALLYMAGKTLIALYLGTTALASSYGAAGAVVLILVWMYYSAQVFLYGAELSRQIALANSDKTRDENPLPATMLATKATNATAAILKTPISLER